MSTIQRPGPGGANSNGPKADDARAKTREREIGDKHKSDIEALRAAHRSEMERLVAAQAESDERRETRHKSAMSDVEARHQREIRSIRDLYEKRRRDGSEAG